MIALAVAALLFAVPQTVPAPEQARLAAAKTVIDQVLPPTERDRMVEAMIEPMNASIVQAMTSSPELTGVFEKDPAFKAKFMAFIAEEQRRSTVLLKANMPAFADAMAKAYARRFTVAQLDEIAVFFATPTGSAYVAQSMTLMSDPDVQAAQAMMMTQAMSGMQTRIADFVRDAASAAAKD